MLDPGKYSNKRGDSIELIRDEIYMRGATDINRHRVYTDTGTCLMWHSGLERYVMDTDPRSDLCLKVRQAQDSLSDQMIRVIKMAEQKGEYDAADWIKSRFFP